MGFTNDNELVYIYRNYKSDIVVEFLMNKYTPLFKSKLSSFHIKKEDKDDFLQEELMCVITALKTYNEQYNKTFCRYLELLAERAIMRVLNDRNKEFQAVSNIIADMESYIYLDVINDFLAKKQIDELKELDLDPIKKLIIDKIILGNMSYKEFSEKYHLSIKQIYNQVYLLKTMIKGKIF